MLTPLKVFKGKGSYNWGRISSSVYLRVQRNISRVNLKDVALRWRRKFRINPEHIKTPIKEQFWTNYHVSKERFLAGFHEVWAKEKL